MTASEQEWLDKVGELLQAQADVRDGSDGTLLPNEAMLLLWEGLRLGLLKEFGL